MWDEWGRLYKAHREKENAEQNWGPGSHSTWMPAGASNSEIHSECWLSFTCQSFTWLIISSKWLITQGTWNVTTIIRDAVAWSSSRHRPEEQPLLHKHTLPWDMQLTNACTEPQEHTALQNRLRTAHGNGFNELCTTGKDKSDCTIKSDQHNLHQRNSCIITEKTQVHQHCVAAEIILYTQQWEMTLRNDGQSLAQCIVLEFLLFKSHPSFPPSVNFARHTQVQCLQLLKLLWSKQFV